MEKQCSFQKQCKEARQDCSFAVSKTCKIAINLILDKNICPDMFFQGFAPEKCPCDIPTEILETLPRKTDCYMNGECFRSIHSEIGDLIFRRNTSDLEEAKKIIKNFFSSTVSCIV